MFADGRAMHRGTLGERTRHACRFDLTVIGNVQPADEVVAVLQWKEVDCLLLADHVDVDSKVLGHRAGAAVLEHPLLVACHVQRPALAPVDGLACLGFQPGVELG